MITLEEIKKRQYDYNLEVKIEIKDQIFENLIGKIYLPNEDYHIPYLYINISSDMYKYFNEGKGYLRVNNDSIEMTSEEIWIYIYDIENLNNNEFYPVICELNNLKIKLTNSNFNYTVPNFEVFLNNNSYINLATFENFNLNFDGSIDKISSSNTNMNMFTQNKMKLKSSYNFVNLDTKLIRYKQLIVTSELKNEKINEQIEEVLKKIDSFLQLTSLISREFAFYHKTKLYKDDFEITFYRGFFSFPKSSNLPFHHSNGIIIPPLFNNFIETTFDKFNILNNIKKISYPIYYLTNSSDDMSIESKYLLFFAGLETLLDLYKKNNNLEKCLSNSKAKKFNSYIRECIRNYEKITEDEKKVMLTKVSELNRIPISKIYELFCNEYKVKTSDLWPVFSEDNILSLSKLRNNLIHGITIPSNYIKYMLLATKNLRILLERCYLSMLEWDLAQTNIMNAEMNKGVLKSYIVKLSELFKNEN